MGSCTNYGISESAAGLQSHCRLPNCRIRGVSTLRESSLFLTYFFFCKRGLNLISVIVLESPNKDSLILEKNSSST